jgi:hypothetical protein
MLMKVGAQGAPHHLKRDQPPWDLHFLGDGVNPPLEKALGSSGDCASGKSVGSSLERKVEVYIGQVGLGSTDRYLSLTPERFRTQLDKLSAPS